MVHWFWGTLFFGSVYLWSKIQGEEKGLYCMNVVFAVAKLAIWISIKQRVQDAHFQLLLK